MTDAHAELLRLLRDRDETVACAESLTGGELAALLSRAPGSSAVFRGGVVAYATQVKRDVLGVRAEHVVSAGCAEQLATGVRALLGSDWGVGTTGVAGPDEQEGKPVGTVFVAVAGARGVTAAGLRLSGGRAEIRAAASDEALRMLLREVRGGA